MLVRRPYSGHSPRRCAPSAAIEWPDAQIVATVTREVQARRKASARSHLEQSLGIDNDGVSAR
jgi:hypothetical protein